MPVETDVSLNVTGKYRVGEYTEVIEGTWNKG